jgi:hypothetical protein
MTFKLGNHMYCRFNKSKTELGDIEIKIQPVLFHLVLLLDNRLQRISIAVHTPSYDP